MRVYFSRLNNKNESLYILGDLYMHSSKTLRFIADNEFECILNDGPFKGTELRMDVQDFFIDRNTIHVDGLRKTGEKSYHEDGFFFYINKPTE